MQSVCCAGNGLYPHVLRPGKIKKDPVYKVSIKVCLRHSHNTLLYTWGVVKATCACLALLHVLFLALVCLGGSLFSQWFGVSFLQ